MKNILYLLVALVLFGSCKEKQSIAFRRRGNLDFPLLLVAQQADL